MKKILLVCALLMLAKIASAQTVTGKVTAQQDGAPIPGVSVTTRSGLQPPTPFSSFPS
jgi:phosphate-selective porin